MKYTTYYAVFVIFCLLFNSNLIAEEKGIHLRKDNSTEAPVNQLVITGTLVKEDGSPCSGEKVWAFGEKIAIKVGQKGRLLNPTANTDQKGRFRLQFDRTLFGNKDIQIAIARGDFMTFHKLINEKGLPVVFSLEPGVREFDLGNIRVE